jgi:hypothetical protein
VGLLVLHGELVFKQALGILGVVVDDAGEGALEVRVVVVEPLLDKDSVVVVPGER